MTDEETRSKVLTAYREVLGRPTVRDYNGVEKKRDGSFVEAHEIYKTARYGLVERQVFEVLNDEVRAGRMTIRNLRYYLR